ncbi:hypothetical protein D9M69_624800 [compost metagenome]
MREHVHTPPHMAPAVSPSESVDLFYGLIITLRNRCVGGITGPFLVVQIGAILASFESIQPFSPVAYYLHGLAQITDVRTGCRVVDTVAKTDNKNIKVTGNVFSI